MTRFQLTAPASHEVGFPAATFVRRIFRRCNNGLYMLRPRNLSPVAGHGSLASEMFAATEETGIFVPHNFVFCRKDKFKGYPHDMPGSMILSSRALCVSCSPHPVLPERTPSAPTHRIFQTPVPPWGRPAPAGQNPLPPPLP